jgi:hypothetical protein
MDASQVGSQSHFQLMAQTVHLPQLNSINIKLQSYGEV